MRPALPATLSAAALLALGLAAPPARAESGGGPARLVGAWGADGSCSADVVIFRPDGRVLVPGAPPLAPPTTYSVSGSTITFRQGGKTGQFAFAINDQAVAWSDGSSIVLRERCADQTAFALPAAAAQGAAPRGQAPLAEKVRTLAAEPMIFNGVTIPIRSVDARPAGAGGKDYGEVVASPDAAMVGAGAALIYRIFPTAAAAAADVSLVSAMRTSFIYEHRGPGFFSTASAADEGQGGAGAPRVTINCLRFHPRGQEAVEISCFAQLPGSALVAGGRQRFPLPAGAKPNDMGSKDDLSEVLDLTGLAIDRLRGLAGAPAAP